MSIPEENAPWGAERKFSLTVLGRTLDHLGRQTYKRRDVAIVELIANCWDAGATLVNIVVPNAEEYDLETSAYIVEDNGSGMSEKDVDEDYLVVGRNRRESEGGEGVAGEGVNARSIMGRKGIGKLAGFGIARRIEVQSWKGGAETRVILDAEKLRAEDGKSADISLEGRIGPAAEGEIESSGTRVILTGLKHKAPLELSALHQAVARRFSRRVRGQMEIFINGEPVGDPVLNFEFKVPEGGNPIQATLPDGNVVSYAYGFTTSPIQSRDLRGFTILAHGKTAQAPPFYFDVEGTASGQHGTKYLTGEIYADYLDDGNTDELDIISTDRQDIDWENDRAAPLLKWGQDLTRKLLREWANRRGDELVKAVDENSDFAERLSRLDPPSQKQLRDHLKKLGQIEADPERQAQLADALIRAYEYRHFHDLIEEIDAASADAEELHRLLSHLADWRVMESRAILEIVKGRLSIVEKFGEMIRNNTRETAHEDGQDNLHDLIAGYPWLLNPDWQVLAEEKRISTQLKEWNYEDVTDEDDRLRYDFLALVGEGQLCVIEIKRSGHAVELTEASRLNAYRERLRKAHSSVYMMLVGSSFAISDEEKDAWKRRPDGELVTWDQIHERIRRHYEHYRALLEGDLKSAGFGLKEEEVRQTRHVLSSSSHRSREARQGGLGPQDMSLEVESVSNESR